MLSQETRSWIDAQNAYAQAVVSARPGRAAIRERIAALARFDTQSVPQRRGRRYFLSKRRASDDLPSQYSREGLSGADEVLLDPHPLSADHTVSVSVEHVSEDGRILLYGLRRGGEDETELRVRDVAKRADLADVLPRQLYRGGRCSRTARGSTTPYRTARPASGSAITRWALRSHPRA